MITVLLRQDHTPVYRSIIRHVIKHGIDDILTFRYRNYFQLVRVYTMTDGDEDTCVSVNLLG